MTDRAPELVGVVLAAGEGRRLRPLTSLRPKPLCPVANRALVDWALDRLAPHVTRLAVNAHHLAGQLDAHLAGTGVHVSHEEHLLGSAGALGRLRRGSGTPTSSSTIRTPGSPTTSPTWWQGGPDATPASW